MTVADTNLDDLIAAIKSGAFDTDSRVIGGGNFDYLQGPFGGIWNEAMGQVELDQHDLYVLGDEWGELPTDGAALAELQRQLIAAGYMDDSNVVFGSPDLKTASAMAELLGSSNATGKVWRTTLAERLAMAGLQPPKKERAQALPLTIELSNPDDIRAMIQSGANEMFGKYLDPVEVEKFVSSYQAQQAAFQTEQYSASGFEPATGREILNPDGTRATRSVTSTAPATGEGAQRQFFGQMAEAHPTETRAAIFTDKLDEIINGLLGPRL